MSQHLTRNFFKTPNSIFTMCDQPGYTHTCLKVFLYLSQFQEAKEIFPSIAGIAKNCRSGENMVKKAVKWLRLNGFIDVKSGKKHRESNSYLINFDVFDASCKESSNVIELKQA